MGGYKVSSAKDLQQLNDGASVMRAGIIFQFSNTVVFIVLFLGTVLRLRTKRVTLGSVAEWQVILATCVSTLMVLIRNGYRIVELTDGWRSHLMRTEAYLIGLDMVPMAIAIGAFVVFPPSLFLLNKKKVEVEK